MLGTSCRPAGTLLWKWPRGLEWLRPVDSTVSVPEWLEPLGEGSNGPWLVDRLIGAREFERKQDPLSTTSFNPVNTKVGAMRHAFWAGDGTGRSAGLAATTKFPNMNFQFWDEAHSASLVLQHAVEQDEEVKKVDELARARHSSFSLDITRENFKDCLDETLHLSAWSARFPKYKKVWSESGHSRFEVFDARPE